MAADFGRRNFQFHQSERLCVARKAGSAEGAVRRAIKRQGTRNFWSLRLPRETRNHVPKFYAALIIGTDPEKYGFSITPEMPYATEMIAVDDVSAAKP